MAEAEREAQHLSGARGGDSARGGGGEGDGGPGTLLIVGAPGCLARLIGVGEWESVRQADRSTALRLLLHELDHAEAGGVVKAVLEGLAPGGVFGLFVVAFLQGIEFCPDFFQLLLLFGIQLIHLVHAALL